MLTFQLNRGHTPLLVSMPHDGTRVPDEVEARMTPEALAVPDTDWHVSRLYDFAGALGAGTLWPFHSRYVVDLNRAPDGAELYPGASNTELCPLTTFDGDPVYREGEEPNADEIEARRQLYWAPYHIALQEELLRLRERHGVAVLWEAHTIRSEVPRFFDGVLPDLNLGTVDGASCAPALRERLGARLAGVDGYRHVVDGRFKGGYIARAYGEPDHGVHAVQLEIAQRNYMDEEAPYPFREDLAARLRPVLRDLLETASAWAHEQ